LKNNSLLFAGVMLVCFGVSVGARYYQFEVWEKNSTAYFVGERPLMTTLDAPYWLRWAREYNEGTYGEKGGLREYPESTETFNEKLVKELSIPLKYTDITHSNENAASSSKTNLIRYRDVPLLSFVVAHIAPFFNYNYYLTGTLLIPVLASLFILPLGIYFFSINLPLSGLLGGLIGTFASGYYLRSSIGRIDTDMLNLFFPVFAALLILWASNSKKDRTILLYSIGAGLCLFLFHWWYGKAGFNLVYFMVLVFILFIQQIRFQTILLSAIFFVLCLDPGNFMNGTGNIKNFLQTYFVVKEAGTSTVINFGSSPATFPNVFSTISEVDSVPFEEVFRRVLSNTTLDWIGFLVFLVLVVFRWRMLIPFVPMLALGLMSFQSSNRFIMYLAPFIGIGLGLLLNYVIDTMFLLIRYYLHHSEYKDLNARMTRKKVESYKIKDLLWDDIRLSLFMKTDENSMVFKLKQRDESLSKKSTGGTGFDWWNWVRQLVLYGAMGIFFWLISVQTAISFVPSPSIHPNIYKTFFEIKKRVPDNSVLLTWWDYGYAITDATDLATFHDGGSQSTPKTYFIARALISADQNELYKITKYLATEGKNGLEKNNTSPGSLLTAVQNPEHNPWDPIYLFFTADMTGKYGAISKLGSWDIENGGSKPRAYQNLACNKITNQEITCRGATIDLKAGFINNHLALRRLIFIRNGQVFREQKFGHDKGFTLQLIVARNNIVEVQLIDEAVFLSNYNQMFLLGRYRKDLFEEAYNAFPFSRLYRINY